MVVLIESDYTLTAVCGDVEIVNYEIVVFNISSRSLVLRDCEKNYDLVSS